MRATYDAVAGMVYVYFADDIAHGGAVQTVVADNGAVLDFDADGRLLGVELPANRAHPDLLAVAERIGWGDPLSGLGDWTG